MIKSGKRTAMNQKSNKILKEKFLKAGITRCEYPGCGNDNYLTFAHRYKRRNLRTVEELSDFNNVLLLCLVHHQMIEFNKELTEELFNKLRP